MELTASSKIVMVCLTYANDMVQQFSSRGIVAKMFVDEKLHAGGSHWGLYIDWH